MADPAQFGHDNLGSLLHSLLKVPRFQRRYAWTAENISDYWTDIERARSLNNSYFLGTVVLAADPESENRRLIVDGQQRITTTALLLIAIRDRLRELQRDEPARSVEREHLSDYILFEEANIPRLTLTSDDHYTYSLLLDGSSPLHDEHDLIASGYEKIKQYVDELAPAEGDYRRLIDLVSYIDSNLQVLTAVATGLAEAYVIFETLNDRGAELTTADLLKNYLFSEAGDAISHVEASWVRLSARFDDPEDLVKFLRYEYMSRRGRVTHRALYKAMQSDVAGGSVQVRSYLGRLEDSLTQYVALREPDDASWSSQAVEVRDSLLAFRRFGFDSSTPLLLAAFATWNHTEATRFVDVVAAWSVRAWMAGTLGGGVAEAAFCDAAVAVAEGRVTAGNDVRRYMLDLVPDDAEFKQAFLSYGSINSTRAKYLLARLERQLLIDNGELTDAMPDWSSKTVTVEHIFAKSMKPSDFTSTDEFDSFVVMKDQIQNLTLFERTLNANLEDKLFSEKKATYAQSAFRLTREVGSLHQWTFVEARTRAEVLADLAVRAWPR